MAPSHKISTWETPEKSRPWRYNCPAVRDWNPQVVCRRKNLPLEQMVEGNGMQMSNEHLKASTVGQFIKNLPRVPLTPADVADIAGMVRTCPGSAA